jgi:hypothetical protein
MSKKKTPDEVKSPIEMIEILSAEQFNTAKKFVDLGEKLKCKTKVRYATRHKLWKCTFTVRTPLKSTLLYTLECTEQTWHIRVRLFNINEHIKFLHSCSDNIKNIIKNGLKCSQCNPECRCIEPFTLENVLYQQCIFCNFTFADFNDDEWESILSLIENEFNILNPVKLL